MDMFKVFFSKLCSMMICLIVIRKNVIINMYIDQIQKKLGSGSQKKVNKIVQILDPMIKLFVHIHTGVV